MKYHLSKDRIQQYEENLIRFRIRRLACRLALDSSLYLIYDLSSLTT